MVLYNSCGKFKSISESEFSSSSDAGKSEKSGQQAFGETVYLITRSKCISCHETQNSPLHAAADVDVAYMAARSKVNFTNVPGSMLVIKIRDGHCKLSNCMTDGSEMINEINKWKAFEKFSSGPGVDASDAQPRHGGRKFVASKLRDVFGATANDPVVRLVDNDAGNYGDPCDKYSRDFNGNQNFGDCRDLGESQASSVGPATPTRQSLTIRACTKITQSDAAVINAVTLAVGSDATARTLTAGDIQSLYDLFFTGRLAQTTTTTALKAIATSVEQKAYVSLDQWRFVLLTLCMSPDWQVP